jgi:hypothetical protein
VNRESLTGTLVLSYEYMNDDGDLPLPGADPPTAGETAVAW